MVIKVFIICVYIGFSLEEELWLFVRFSYISPKAATGRNVKFKVEGITLMVTGTE